MFAIGIVFALIFAAVMISQYVKHEVCTPNYPSQEWDESDEEHEKKRKEAEEGAKIAYRLIRRYIIAGASVLSLIVLAFSMIKIIPTGEVGVKTAFGVVSGKSDEGFNFIAPWEDIVSMNTRIQKQSFTGLTASTKDAQLISNISIDVNYSLNPDSAEQVFSTVGENYQDTLISPLLTQFIKDRLALYNAESLVVERNKVVDDITEQLRNNLESYGIKVVAVSLVNYDFSADFSSALERKAVAAKEIETAKNNQEKAKVEAETNRIKTQQLTEPVLMEKLIDAIRNGNGTYIVNTNDLSIGVK